VQEAAKIGLYGMDFLMNAMGDQSGLTLPVAVEEMFWGDAGIGMAIMGSSLRRASPATARPSRSWSGCPSATAPLTT
jgi:acyl-CoA dehydrogenase